MKVDLQLFSMGTLNLMLGIKDMSGSEFSAAAQKLDTHEIRIIIRTVYDAGS
jgi:hypothetical protein